MNTAELILCLALKSEMWDLETRCCLILDAVRDIEKVRDFSRDLDWMSQLSDLSVLEFSDGRMRAWQTMDIMLESYRTKPGSAPCLVCGAHSKIRGKPTLEKLGWKEG